MKHRAVLRTIGAAFTSIVIALAFVPGIASAHAILDSSSPAPSALLATSPQEIRLEFDEQVEATLGDIRLYDSGQHEVTIEKTVRSSSNTSVVTAGVPTLKTGVYVVVWRVVSADGHPVTGAFPFEIGTKSSGTTAALLQKILNGTKKTSPVGNAMATFRLLGFLAVLVLLGSVSLLWRSELLANRRARALLKNSSLGLAVSSLGLLLLQGPFTTGKSWGALFNSHVLGNVLHTRLGMALFLRAICALMWARLAVSVSSTPKKGWRIATIITGISTVATFAFSGHQSAGTLPGVFIPLDMIHVAAISTWVGALLVLVVMSRDNNVENEAERFSQMATWSMPLVVVSGVVQGIHLIGSIGSIAQSYFGKLLVVKTILVGLIILFGAAARVRLRANGFSSIRTIIRRESVLVVLVLTVTSLMVAQSPRSETSRSVSFDKALVQNNILAELSVIPAAVGPAEVHVVLTPPGGSLSPVVAVTVQFDLPSRNIPPIPVKMIEIGPNHWTGVVQFPYSGTWSMKARVSPAANQTLLFDTPVVVRG